MTVMTITTGKIYSYDSDDSNKSDDIMTGTTSNDRYPVMTGTTSDITWTLCLKKIKKYNGPLRNLLDPNIPQ